MAANCLDWLIEGRDTTANVGKTIFVCLGLLAGWNFVLFMLLTLIRTTSYMTLNICSTKLEMTR